MYSIDYKKRAVEYKQEGHSFKELKAVFKISSQTYYRWAKEYKNNFAPKARVEYTRKIDKEQLLKALEEKPDAYLRELAEPFGASIQAVYYFLEKHKITYKKKRSRTQKSQKKPVKPT
jgi:transposase